MPDFYEDMYEHGFDDPEDYMDYLEERSVRDEEYEEDYDDENPIEDEPHADAFYIDMSWVSQDADFVKMITDGTMKIIELAKDGEEIPQDAIEDYLDLFDDLGWRNVLDDDYKHYTEMAWALACIAVQERNTIVAVASAYCAIRDLTINKSAAALPVLLVLITKQLLAPQMRVSLERENYHEEKEIKPPYYWRNIAYYALHLYCSANKIDINSLDVDHTADPSKPKKHLLEIDDTILYNVVHCRDTRVGDTDEEKLKNGQLWMLRRFYSALVESLDMDDLGQYDDDVYPNDVYTERDWERDNAGRYGW